MQQDECEQTRPITTNNDHLVTPDAFINEKREIPILVVVNDSEVVTRQISSPSAMVGVQRIRSTDPLADEKDDPLVFSRGEELGEVSVDRKQFLHHATRVSESLLFMPDTILVAELSELSERVIRAVQKPSTIDVSLFTYLEKRSQVYWQERHSAAVASFYLLTDVKEHLQKMTKLLEGTLLRQSVPAFVLS